MVNQTALNIVIACEQEDARSLVESVNECMGELLDLRVENIKKDIGKKLLGENVADIFSGDWEDRFESYSTEIQEAIEEVVDKALEGKDIKECIVDVSSRRNVPVEKLKEFFETVLEDTIAVDSTKETGTKTLRNRERMDDEDISKRIRFEGTVTAKDLIEAIVTVKAIEFDSGEKGVKITDEQAKAIKTVFENLNESNRNLMVNKMTENRAGFIEMVSWCVKATK